ncbi:unnamed protein product, partial [Laminaria digitata]
MAVNPTTRSAVNTASAANAAGSARHRAWLPLEDDEDGSNDGPGGGGGGSRNSAGGGCLYGSAVEREVIINRLIHERDLRLSSPAIKEEHDLGITPRRRRDKSHIDAEPRACNDGLGGGGPRLNQDVAKLNTAHSCHRRGDNVVVSRG